jgi:regulator of RNase E activity RraA
LSNAIEKLGVRPRKAGFAPQQIRCLFPELGRLCGFALTAQVETTSEANERHEEQFVELSESVGGQHKPAVVVFQEIGPQPDFSAHCGEVMATIFRRLGAVGLVTNSSVRDAAELRRLAFPCFGCGLVASHANFRIVRVNIPVQVLGLLVRPGDLLHGDENGLLTVPDVATDEIVKAVESVRTQERKLLDYVKGEGFIAKDLRGRFLH